MPRGQSATCTKDHGDAKHLLRLPLSQAQPQRHRCAACAYERGYQDGLRQGQRDMEARVKGLVARVKGWAGEA